MPAEKQQMNSTIVSVQRFLYIIILILSFFITQSRTLPILILNDDVFAKESDHSAENPSLFYLPIINNNFSSRPTIFGAQISPWKVELTIDKAVEGNINWVRYFAISWAAVEATQGIHKWGQISGVESELQLLGENGLTPIVIIHYAPLWAHKVPGSYCGPIHEDALDDFADFMFEVVTRYSKPPYNVKYWEIWNEPDVSYTRVGGYNPYGCWGEKDDPYFGGGYYGEMLEQVYPAIKTADPFARVILGGLLLDCDPTNPLGKDCSSSLFLEGILQNDSGYYFDIVAYHAYSFWSPLVNDWDGENTYWKHRGGIVLGKKDFIQQVLASYELNKPIFLAESSLLCLPSNPYCPSEEYTGAKAIYVIQMYTRTWSNGLLGSTWYTLDGPGWRGGGLLDADQDPDQAYIVFQFLSTLLKDATYNGKLSSGVLEGYRFRKANNEYHIYWMNDETSSPLPLPAGTQTVYNKLGQDITPSGSSIIVDAEPIIIEINTNGIAGNPTIP